MTRHRVILTDEIVYNPVDDMDPGAVPASRNPCLVGIGLVLRIQRGSPDQVSRFLFAKTR